MPEEENRDVWEEQKQMDEMIDSSKEAFERSFNFFELAIQYSTALCVGVFIGYIVSFSGINAVVSSAIGGLTGITLVFIKEKVLTKLHQFFGDEIPWIMIILGLCVVLFVLVKISLYFM